MSKIHREFNNSNGRTISGFRAKTYSPNGRYETTLGKTLTLIEFLPDGTLVGKLFGKVYTVPVGEYWPCERILGDQ
jgi:hypothetical protein